MRGRFELRLVLVALSCVGAAGCGSEPTTDRGGESNGGGGLARAAQEPSTNAATETPTPPTTAHGFTDAEERSITTAAINVFANKTFNQSTIEIHRQPCSMVFSMGAARIADASLSGETGHIQIVIPITAVGPLLTDRPAVFTPAYQCFGASPNLWVPGHTVNVSFDFEVRHWQSGWQLVPPREPGL